MANYIISSLLSSQWKTGQNHSLFLLLLLIYNHYVVYISVYGIHVHVLVEQVFNTSNFVFVVNKYV